MNKNSAIYTENDQKIKNIIIFFRSWLVFLIIWHLFAIYIDNHILVASPIKVVSSLFKMIGTGEMFKYITTSLGRLLVGYSIALIVGVGLGIIMGLSSRIRYSMEPIIEIFRPITGIAWIPIAFLVFGIGSFLPIFIVFYSSFFPILTNTVHAVRTVNPILVRSAQTMGIPKFKIVTHVIVPSSVPLILTGLRVGVGLAWMGIVAGELLGSSAGLGYELAMAQQLLETSKLFAIIIVIGLLGYGSDFVLRFIQRKFVFWG